MNKKISVIIPAHNEEEVIERSVKSIQEQNFRNFEIIVVNDGSTDKTRKIVERLMKKDKRIKLINFSKGHSAAFARNRGAEKAKGNIFVFLDADTKINKIFLEEISKKSMKGNAFITMNYALKEKIISKVLSGLLPPPIKEKLKDGSVYGKNNSSEGGSMFFCISKKAFKKIGGYNEDVFYFEDEEFSDKFYNAGFKSVFSKKSEQYFELPSSLSEFFRQCKWIGKGINSIKDRKIKDRKKNFWFLKSIFLVSPIFFLFNISYFLVIFASTLFVIYVGLVTRNKNPFLSLLTLPFVYIKILLVSFNIIKFWK